jgi:hypothetical protein
MAGTLTPTPYQTVLDGDGVAVSGAKITTTDTGTGVAAATYTTQALSAANTNPIVTDSAGRYVAYLPAGSNFTFAITTSAGAAIETQTNIQAVPGASVNLDIEGTVGQAVTAGQVLYLSSAAESPALTAGKWYLTDSDAAVTSTSPQSIGVAVSAIAINTAGTIRLAGEVNSAGTVVVGTTYYIGATPGAIVSSAPANSRQVGVGLTTSSLLLAATTAVASLLPNPITQDLLFVDNTYDIGKAGASRPRDVFASRNAVVGGTLGVTGVATLSAQPVLSTLTASVAVFSDGSKGLVSNAITGTGNVVMSASPTLTGTIGAAAATFSGAVTLNGGLNTPLVVAQGGTGVAALTANNLLLGAGTGNVTFAAPSTSGNVLTSNGTVWASAAPSNQVAPSQCDHRLTLTSGLAVTTADVTGASTIYLTPYKGKSVSLYTGSAWVVYTVAELSIATSGGTASKPHDVFLDENGGTPALAILTWTNTTTRATALAVQDGVLVKTGDTSQRYMGTVYLDSSKNCSDAAKYRYVWNYYNRVARQMSNGRETTDTWTYTTATWRQMFGGTNTDQLNFVVGVSEDEVTAINQQVTYNTTVASLRRCAIGLDSTTAFAATCLPGVAVSQGGDTYWVGMVSTYSGLPGIGLHVIYPIEYSSTAGSTIWAGDASDPSGVQSGIRGTCYA